MISKYDDQWTIVKELGHGAYGKVYEIHRNDFGHVYKAALKVIRIPNDRAEVTEAKSQGMDEESVSTYYESIVKEIIREIDAMSELQGTTNIVNYQNHKVVSLTDDIGWEIYLQMELLTPLSSYMSDSDNVLTEVDVINLGIDICQALSKCRKNNIIHRDIKPANIFINKDGVYKLGDFGIARSGENTLSEMSTKGTWEYMAPEVLKSNSYQYTVDIYSLGVVMYRLVNDYRLPFFPPYPELITFLDKNKALTLRLNGEEPIPVPKHGSSRLSEIILKAMSYKPEERYQSASDMKRDLESLKVSLLVDMDEKDFPNLAPQGTGNMSAVPDEKEESQKKIDSDDFETVGIFDRFKNESESSKLINIKEKKQNTDEVIIEKKKVLQNTPNSEKKKSVQEPIKSEKKRSFLPILVGAALLIIIATGVLFLKGSKKTLMMSDLYNMTVEEATETVENQGLLAEITEEFSNDVEKGKVISQQPEVNTEVKAGDKVSLVVSKGKEVAKAAIPDGKKIGEDTIEVGDTVILGEYEQDNQLENGAEAIEWRVLTIENGNALLQTVYGLENKPFNENMEDVTWETSSIREWLNSDFYDIAFGSEEQSKIKETLVKASDNPKYDTDPGNDTYDNVFLLSIQEAEKYYSSDEERACKATAYAEAMGSRTTNEEICIWWLRTPGNTPDKISYVSHRGPAARVGSYADDDRTVIRPAIWVEL